MLKRVDSPTTRARHVWAWFRCNMLFAGSLFAIGRLDRRNAISLIATNASTLNTSAWLRGKLVNSRRVCINNFAPNRTQFIRVQFIVNCRSEILFALCSRFSRLEAFIAGSWSTSSCTNWIGWFCLSVNLILHLCNHSQVNHIFFVRQLFASIFFYWKDMNVNNWFHLLAWKSVFPSRRRVHISLHWIVHKCVVKSACLLYFSMRGERGVRQFCYRSLLSAAFAQRERAMNQSAKERNKENIACVFHCRAVKSTSLSSNIFHIFCNFSFVRLLVSLFLLFFCFCSQPLPLIQFA